MALKNILKSIFYKPHLNRFLIDFFAWFISIGIMVIWRVSAEKFIVGQYVTMFLHVFLLWTFVAYFCGKYQHFEQKKFFNEIILISTISVITFGVIYVGIAFEMIDFKLYSKYVAIWVVLGMIILNYLFISIYHAYRYAASMDDFYPKILKRDEVKVLEAPYKLDESSIEEIRETILQYGDENLLKFISQYIDLESSNTKILASTTFTNFKMLRKYRYDAVINLAKLNTIRGINKILCTLNQKLPDDGLFCCNFRTIEMMQDYIRRNYPPVIRQIALCAFFIQKRILPKMFLTSRIYFDITKGKKRTFSKTEIFGRLYYCGFEVVDEYSDNSFGWVVARRTSLPQPYSQKKLYGFIIKLPRIGKNGEVIYFYKMRTMYPYAEYLQKYVYEKCGTDDIGKAKNDIRITDWGRTFRKFWIDELPMIYNLLRGDLKIVGVRPLSKTFFETYPEYLQQKRIKTKPGLVPPFYYDLPKTTQEIYDSEERYIDQYLKSPFLTDIKYFFTAMWNIFVKKARSH